MFEKFKRHRRIIKAISHIVRRRQKAWSDGLSDEQKREEARNRYGREFKCNEQVHTLEQEKFAMLDKGREIPNWLRKD